MGSVVCYVCVILSLVVIVSAGDPSRFFNMRVTYGVISPMGVRQRGILINGRFPGRDIEAYTDEILLINVFNRLPEPFLISWNGVQQRKNSFEDGVYGTTCPIPPGKNFTYNLHLKDQIGCFFYFPSLAFHKAAGGFGAIRILSRPKIPVPFPRPAADYSILIGDWYKLDHWRLKAMLDHGMSTPFPNGILINGRGANGASFQVEHGKTYRLRISNVGLQNSLNFRIQDHSMKLVEVEGTHTTQKIFSSHDVHVGQSYSVLVTANKPTQDYLIAVSTCSFTPHLLTTTAILNDKNSADPVRGVPPSAPTNDINWSMNQARHFIRTNLTASGPRSNPQGSYHYGQFNITRTIRLVSSPARVNGKLRYGVNSVSFIPVDTPLKLADYYKIKNVFREGSIPDNPTGHPMNLDTSVMGADLKTFVEVAFENHEPIVQSQHLDVYSLFVVGYIPTHGLQFTLPSDNVGMWNMRSELWARQYLRQQFYLRVSSPANSIRDENRIPENTLHCGRVGVRSTHPF